MWNNIKQMTLSSFIRLFSNVLVFIILAKVWGPIKFGLFIYPFSLASMSMVIIDFGLGILALRDISHSPHFTKKILINNSKVKISIIFLTLLFFVITQDFFFSEPQTILLFWIFFFANTLQSFGNLFNYALRGLNSFKKEKDIIFQTHFLLFALLLFLIFKQSSPVPFALAFLIARLFYFLMSFKEITLEKRKLDHAKLKTINKESFFNSLKTAMPFGMHAIFGTLFFQVDTIFLKKMIGIEAVGLYQTGFRIMLAGLIFADILNSVYLNKLAKTKDENKLGSIILNMNRYFFILGCLGFVTISNFIYFKSFYLFGDQFSELRLLLPFFGIVLFLRYQGAPFGLILTLFENQKQRMTGVILATILNILLNYFLIIKWGIIGALTASILTHIFLNVYYMYKVQLLKKDLAYSKKSLAFFILIYLLIILSGLFMIMNNFLIFQFFLWSTLALTMALFKKKDANSFISKTLLKRSRNTIQTKT